MTEQLSHWLRANHQNRFPRRFVYMDSEAFRHQLSNGERHTFRLAAAAYDEIDPLTKMAKRTERESFELPEDLWSWIDSKTIKRRRTVLWALNLGYDLRLTQCFLILPKLGWRLKACAFGARSCWAQWQRDGRSLVMVDLFSFVPKSLERIGTELGLAKSPLPSNDAGKDEWIERCKTDVEITRAGALELVRWLEDSDLGSFRITGASQSIAAYRHRFMPPKSILIHNDEQAREAERRSSWTGRCEVWKHGPTDDILQEWDYSLAYATIARENRLPAQLLSTRQSFSRAEFEQLSNTYRILAEVTVKTDVPVVPAENDDKILWPVGKFDTVLWDDEIRLALSEGAELKFRRAWIYRARPVLHDWAEWIIDSLEGSNPETHPLGRIVLKTWSRALIGRFGLRHPTWKDFGMSPISDLLYLPYLDLETSEHGVVFQVGNDLLEQANLSDARESAPAIMAAIMSAARVRLWHTMKRAGFNSVFYVDTDSIIVGANAHSKLLKITQENEFAGLRLKSTFQGADFRAPRNIMLGRQNRIAGIPKTATESTRGIFTGIVWQSITAALSSGNANAVSIRARSFNTSSEDFRRDHLPDGLTGAYVLK